MTRPASPPARQRLHAFRAGLLDVLFPPVCLACREPVGDPDALCTACWTKIDFIRPPLCDRLGIPLRHDTRVASDAPSPIFSAAAIADPPAWRRARAVAVFGDVMKRLIHGLKYHDRHDGRRMFGRLMAHAGAELLADADVIVPVPLHPMRLISRKFNQSAILAGEISRLSGVPIAPAALSRIRRTPSQVGMTSDERRGNVAGAFRVPAVHRQRIAGKRVVLIDDVITTGATCRAAAAELKRAKAAHVDVLALAVVCQTI